MPKILGRKNAASDGNIDIEKSGSYWVAQKDGRYTIIMLSDNLNQTEDDLISTAGVPQVGDLFNNSIVRGYSCREVDRVIHPNTHIPAMLWEVQIKTDSRFDPAQTLGTGDDPVDLRPKRRWYTEKENRRFDYDNNGHRIVTAAGEPIVYERPFVVICLEIERYEAYPANPSAIYAYAGHSNTETFYGAPIGSVLLDDIQVEEEVIQNVTLLKVRYVFKFYLELEEGVLIEDTVVFAILLNQGYLYRPSPHAPGITYVDTNGHPVKVNLDTEGTLLAETDDPIFAYYPVVPLVSFIPLNLEF